MSDESIQEKTEKATPKRKRESREKGQVVYSKEVSSFFILLVVTGAFYVAESWILTSVSGMMKHYFREMGSISLRDDSIQTLFINAMADYALIVFPVMLAAVIFGIGSCIMQVGFIISSEALTPKLSRLNPVKGIGKLFSVRSLADIVKSLIKIIALGGLAYFLIKGEAFSLSLLITMEPVEILAFIVRVSLKLGLFTCLAMVAIACLDYIFQWKQHQKDIRMTKQEVKEETKQTEGDPKIKSRIRSIQMEMSRRRMMKSVPEATVIITNPTHLAIALLYDPKNMQAPKVVAKGAGYVAEKIKEIAKSHNVPIIENKPVARIIFKSVNIGAFIPVELYRAVAEILAYVYRLKGTR